MNGSLTSVQFFFEMSKNGNNVSISIRVFTMWKQAILETKYPYPDHLTPKPEVPSPTSESRPIPREQTNMSKNITFPQLSGR